MAGECNKRSRGELGDLQVAYVLLRFPRLTETFVANEICEIQHHGVRVHLFSLLEPRKGLVQPTSERLAKDVQYAPGLTSWRLWWAQLYFLTRSPLTYLALMAHLIRQPYPRPFGTLFFKRVLIFLKAASLAHQLKDTPVKLVHTHFAWLSGAASRIIAELLDLPFTVTVHAYDIFSRSNDLLCFTTSAAAQVIAISEFNRQAVLDACPAVKERAISVIHCGVDLERFSPSTLGEQLEPLSILSVGSLNHKKGHKYLIQACRKLKADGVSFCCTIIGGGPDEQALKKMVCEYALEDLVDLRGPRTQPEVLSAYAEHDVFVLACVVHSSGARDGIPVVLMEAMAMQMPVISTPVSGVPELVRHQETGWIVPERDAPAIAEAIKLLAADRPLRERLGRNGRALVENEFGIRGNAAQLADEFRRIDTQPRGFE
jgi:colanic acid/amylovoran biosynthesis glycosyltransferase